LLKVKKKKTILSSLSSSSSSNLCLTLFHHSIQTIENLSHLFTTWTTSSVFEKRHWKHHHGNLCPLLIWSNAMGSKWEKERKAD
jgi:hypothetical protein